MRPFNLSEQLLHDLGKDIVNGVLKPGTVLPKVELLSEQRGVSRTVSREAIKGLVARRLVESSTRTGTVVKAREEWLWLDPDVLIWASESDHQKEFFMQLNQLRFAIEPAAVELAAQFATEEDKKEIRYRYEQLEKYYNDKEKWPEADYAYHWSIISSSHNELMLSLMQNLYNALIKTRRINVTISSKKERDRSLKLHKELMEEVCNGNGKLAKEAMREQLLQVESIVKAY
ncbi:FadR/GntR family transcriptional regulator [Virgibacillus oceani]